VTELLRRVAITAALAGALVTLAACNDSPGGPRTSQLVSSPTASLAVRVAPIELQLAPAPLASCPMTQPFMTHFDLTIGPPSTDIFLDNVVLQFDSGTTVAAVTRPDLEGLFGSTQVVVGTTRVFSLTPTLGCGFPSTQGSLVIVVTTIDTAGLKHQSSTRVAIR